METQSLRLYKSNHLSTKLLRHIALFGTGVYLLALIVISVVFHEHALQLKWMLWGIGEVLFFFVLTTVFYPRWKDKSPKRFKWTLFLVAFGLRAVYAWAMLYYYYYVTVLKSDIQKAMEHKVADITTVDGPLLLL